MTRKSPREIERAIENLTGDYSVEPKEIVITHQLVETSWSSDDPDPEPKDVSQTHVWRDGTGEWHSEHVDLDDGGSGGES